MVCKENQDQHVFVVINGTRLSSCFKQESGRKISLVLPDPSGGLYLSLQAL